MHQSSGDIGTLWVEGRQVGGFLNWTIQVTVVPGSKGKLRTNKVTQWKATARRFWLLEEFGTDRMQAIFYCNDGMDLKQVSQNQVRVQLPVDYPLNQAISGELVMWHG